MSFAQGPHIHFETNGVVLKNEEDKVIRNASVISEHQSLGEAQSYLQVLNTEMWQKYSGKRYQFLFNSTPLSTTWYIHSKKGIQATTLQICVETTCEGVQP